MSLSVGFDSGLKSLLASQAALQTIGNNIANANTPGYAREQVILSSSGPVTVGGFSFGTGVDVATIRRVVDEGLEQRLLLHGGVLARLGVERAGYQQLESMLTGASLAPQLGGLFGALNGLASHPEDSIGRKDVLAKGRDLAAALRQLSSGLLGFRKDARFAAELRVEEANGLAKQIAALNGQIQAAKGKGLAPHALLDERGRLLGELSKIVESTAIAETGGSMRVLVGGHTLVGGTQAYALVLDGSSDEPALRIQGGVGEIALGEGEVAGLLKLTGEATGALEGNANDFARALILAFNRAHSTGIPASGGFQSLTGAAIPAKGAAGASLPLSDAGYGFEVAPGELYVTVQEGATGSVAKTKIAIDPSESLNDVVAKLSAIPHLSASVDGEGKLRIAAEEGYTFDFSARLDPNPDEAGSFGTVPVSASGVYTGASNDVYTFKPDADGTVGVTPGLTVGVFDSQGNRIATLDVGPGYAPKTEIAVKDGVKVTFGPGDLTAATDSFSLDVVADADTADFLVATGTNAFFTGDSASTIDVRADLAADPALLSLSGTGAAGDGGNLARLLALQTESQESLEGLSLQDFLTKVSSDLGFDAKSAADLETARGQLVADLTREREQVSGVSLEEEMANLVRFQQAFDAAGRYLRVLQDTSASLLDLLR